jgi:hypothetical protein
MPKVSHFEDSLELEQDLQFQYRHWRVERIGWVIIALVVCAGLLGLFGHHPFIRAVAQAPDGQLLIEYDRFVRYESNVDFRVALTSDRDGGGVTRIWFDEEYLDSINVLAISPMPLRGEAQEGKRAFVFQTNGDRFTASFSAQFKTIGMVHGRVNADKGQTVVLSHLVWP